MKGVFGRNEERGAEKASEERQAAPDHRTPEGLRQIRTLAERALDMLDRIRALPDREAPKRAVERVEAPSAAQRVIEEGQRAREARTSAREAAEGREAAQRAREAALGIVRPERDPFAHYRARSGDDYSLTNNRKEHLEVIRLLKENTTDAQYDRFRRGDLTAIEHITDDPVFSRQLLMDVELNNRSTGFRMADDLERVMSDNRDFLKERLGMDNDHDHQNER